MQIVGASHVETLDTKGIDGSNVHLGGPDTIAGYFGGIGQPNDYPIKWADEYLRTLTEYGIRQVLNINSGTILVAMLLHKLGVRNEFKVSVFMGIDNPFSVLWLLMGARLFGAEHGTTGMAGLNLSNSVDATRSASRRPCARRSGSSRTSVSSTTSPRRTSPSCASRTCAATSSSTWPRTCRTSRPSTRARDPDDEALREHPSDIFDYFVPKQQLTDTGLMPALEQNYLDKHAAVCRTAEELTRAGIGVHAAALLHAPQAAKVGATAV